MTATEKVLAKIESLGKTEASVFFGVAPSTIANWCRGKTKPTIDAFEKIDGEVIEIGEENPIQSVEWEGRQVQILMPVYRSLHPKTHFTVFASYARYGPQKIGLSLKERTCIWEARNQLLNDAYEKTDASYFIMVDDDMVIPCENEALFNGKYGAGLPPEMARLNGISRLMSHPPHIEVVGATYFGRHKYGRVQASIGFADQSVNKEFRQFQRRTLTPVDWVGTGFIRIARSAIDKYKAAIDTGVFPELAPRREGGTYGYFTPLVSEMGEDVAFGRRLSQIGVQSYVDGGLVCLHADGGTLYGPATTRDKQ